VPTTGAYFHESFVRDNRDLCLTIARIKAPKKSHMMVKGAGNDGEKTAFKSMTHAAKPVLSSLDASKSVLLNRRWFPACTQAQHQQRTQKFAETAPDVHSSMTTTTSTSCVVNSTSYGGKQQELDGNHQLDGSHQQGAPEISEDFVSEDFEWFINAGVPMSAFDPVALMEIPASSTTSTTTGPISCIPNHPTSPKAAATVESDLMNCADEITSLFAMNPQSCGAFSTSRAPSDLVGCCSSGQTLPLPSLHLTNNAVSRMHNNHHHQTAVPKERETERRSVAVATDHSLPKEDQQLQQLPLNVVNLASDLLFGENLPAIDDALWAL
jgi:hypothetical protein